MARSSALSRVSYEAVLILNLVRKFLFLERWFYRTDLTLSTAWSVSLNPQGDTYASTGGSGNVSIHSAQTDNFGERLSTLTSGRNKFGMFCSYVRLYLPLYPNYSETNGLHRAQTVATSPCPRKQGKSTSSTSNQAPCLSHSPPTQCQYVHWPGPLIQTYVFHLNIFSPTPSFTLTDQFQVVIECFRR